MSCGSLTYGFDYECNDGTGGIKPGSILIAQWDNISSYTTSAGVVTALTQAGATNFYRYQVRKFIAGDAGEGVNDPKMGTVTFTSTFSFTLFNLSGSKNVQLQLLMSKPLVVIYQDNNDVYHVLGITNGAEATGVSRATGVDKQDMNGYTITITSEEGVLPYEVQSSVVSGLTISGDLS
jgi:hypothetical protein